MPYLRELQLRRGMCFDAGGPGAGGGGGKPDDPAAQKDPAPDADAGKAGEEKPGSTVDFNALLKDAAFQAEFDKRVEKALATRDQKTQQLIDEARAEGEKLGKLSAEDRAKAEAQRKADALAEREAKLLAGEFRAAATLEMGEKKLPAALCKVLDYIDAKHHGDEKARQAIVAALEEAHREGVQTGVDARLKSSESPKDSGGGAARNPWAAGQVNLTEQGRILREDPTKAAALKAAAG